METIRKGKVMSTKRVDVVIIGGGPAGLTAALYLGRACKSVVVIDQGRPRHAVSEGVHNFLTRDGMPPSLLRKEAWSQMSAYPSVTKHEATVSSLQRREQKWELQTDDGLSWSSQAVLLATGVIDQHPTFTGFEERWGHSIHHCPYCHGWELRGKPLALLSSGEAAVHMALLLRGWSDTVSLITGGESLEAAQRERIEGAGIPIFDAPVVGVEGPGQTLSQIHLKDGTSLAKGGLFIKPTQRQVALVGELGLKLTEEGYVETDDFGATSLPMMWAAGDMTSRMQQVVAASAQGAKAGAMINAALMMP